MRYLSISDNQLLHCEDQQLEPLLKQNEFSKAIRKKVLARSGLLGFSLSENYFDFIRDIVIKRGHYQKKNSKLQEQSYFSIRNDIDYNIPGLQIIPTKLVLYGVDYMSWERMKHYFQGYITNIVRMDDSHYVVEFRNESECLTAINKYHKSRDIYFTSQDVFKSSKYGWIEMKPYHEFLFERKIMARYWTSVDRIDNVCGTTKQSFSKAYSEAKRRFMKSLKQDTQNCLKERSYRGRSNSKQKQFRSNSRSRQKTYNYQRRAQRIDEERIYQNYRPKRQCTCHRDRERDDFRNRSRSRSPSFDNDFQRRRYSNLPRLSQYQKIQETDMKFQMYIKKRDNITQIKSDCQPKRKALSNIDASMKNNILTQKEKSSSTQEDCQHQLIGVPIPANKTNQALNSSNSEQVDFELFLERLKLEDTKNDYSAFDLEMDG